MRVAWDSAFLVLLLVCLGGKVDGEDVCHKQDEDMQRVMGWLVQYATETHISISLLEEETSRLNHGIESLKRENEKKKTELDILKTDVYNYLTSHACYEYTAADKARIAGGETEQQVCSSHKFNIFVKDMEISPRFGCLDCSCCRTKGCDDGWQQYNGSCYLVSNETFMFYEAQEYCQQHNAKLVHVDNSRENDFIKLTLLTKDEGYWMGLTDKAVEGEWRWVDTNEQITFSDWGPGQPSNTHGNENCADFWKGVNFKWNDYKCDLGDRKAICEKRISDVEIERAVFPARATLHSPCDMVTLVSRAAWGARNATGFNNLKTPVSIVIIHQSGRVKAECQTQQECSREMKSLQNHHMDVDGIHDIAFNFVIGKDGRAYEGRGWNRIGHHTTDWDDVSLSFSVMGSYSNKRPDTDVMQTTKRMIDCGVKLGKITGDYKLYGHRDILPGFHCPGQKFYDVIKTWAHYDSNTPVKPTS